MKVLPSHGLSIQAGLCLLCCYVDSPAAGLLGKCVPLGQDLEGWGCRGGKPGKREWGWVKGMNASESCVLSVLDKQAVLLCSKGRFKVN